MQKRSREEWRTLFAEQAASGLSTRQFCVQRDLCLKHFSLRKRQLSGNMPSAFIHLQKTAPVAISDRATVLLRHGRSELELRR